MANCDTICSNVKFGEAPFHQHSTGKKLPVDLRLSHRSSALSVHHKCRVYILVVHSSKVGYIFVGETDRLQEATSVFVLCAIRLVKLTQGLLRA
jgi:hypothetical protein